MAVADNTHSRLVAWLKIVLPLLALALLSTLFLLSRSIDPTRAIPYADVDIAELTREPRITAPNYAGVTDDGAAVSMTADTARPEAGNAQRLTAVLPRARLETPDGAITDLSAGSGLLDAAAGQLSLSGGVRLTTSTGYVLQTEAMRVALDSTRLETAGTVVATAPMGRISADQMVLEQAAAGQPDYVLVFNGRVKLIYEP